VRMQVGQAHGGAGFGPGSPEGRSPQPATFRADKHQAVVSRLGEPLQVPARFRRDLENATWRPRFETSSAGRRDRGPHAEPLLGAVVLEPLYLDEPQLRREAHRAGVGGLGKGHHRLAGKRAGEPAECRCAGLGGVPASPRLRQEQVAELGPRQQPEDRAPLLC
jgi:hypothetical protein